MGEWGMRSVSAASLAIQYWRRDWSFYSERLRGSRT